MGKDEFICGCECASKKRRVSKFYRQQSNILEKFENDSKHVQKFQQKQLLKSQCSSNWSTTVEVDEAEENDVGSSQKLDNDNRNKRTSSTTTSVASTSARANVANGRCSSGSGGSSNTASIAMRKRQQLQNDDINFADSSPFIGADGCNCNDTPLGFSSVEIATRLLLNKQNEQQLQQSNRNTSIEAPTAVLVANAKDGASTAPKQHILCTDVQSNESLARKRSRTSSNNLALFTLFVNISLTLAKGFASYLSGSLSIVSSLVDSLVDITSGLVIWMTGRAIKKHDPYLYPAGRSRLEPIALVIVSVIMAVASVQMIVQSVESVLVREINPRMDAVTNSIMVTTIVVKFILFLICYRRQKDPSARVLALDHRNDCISNSVALACAICAHKYWIYLDPIGAIVVALYIAITWYQTGKEHLLKLSGRSASPEFINRIIKVSIDFDERIQYIDTVLVYHFGTRFLVEVHIVLDENMRLKETHDISESLQNIIESLPDVERAFVHVDYEYTHDPGDEHKKAY